MLCTGLWAAGYAYVHRLACAFSTPGGCALKRPWDQRGMDLALLVVIPGAVVLALWLAAWALRRGAN